ncbi:MAG: hypothetical protein AAGA30_05870, partial [Planctomycetota bacterium]
MYQIRILFASLGLLTAICNFGISQQLYYEDFESAEIGDLVSTVGIGGAFGELEVQAVGANGTKGFEVPPFESFWTGSFLPETVCLKEVGQRLSLAVDAKIELLSLDSFFSGDFNVLF